MKQNINSKINLAILFGGRSVEHEISIISALQLIKAIDDTKYNVTPVYITPEGKWYTGETLLDKSIYKNFKKQITNLTEVILLPIPKQNGLKKIKDIKSTIPIDVFFPVFHGENGEDGNIQGLFEIAEVDYTGFNVISSAIAMNKFICKKVLATENIPVLPGVKIDKSEFLLDYNKQLDYVINTINLPVFVKPCNRGSSVGISKAENKEQLISGLLNVFKYDLEALVEPLMSNMFEINIAVMGIGNNITTSVVEIPHSESGILSYEDKYVTSGTKKNRESQGMANLTRTINPENLDPMIINKVSEYAKKAFKVLNCTGNTRIDFMHDNSNGNIYLNEINSLPGSLAFYLWRESNPELLYTDLIDKLIEYALEIGCQKASLERFIGFKALK